MAGHLCVTVPADGPVSWTAREDAAQAAAIILASNGAYDGPVTLTAKAAPTFTDIAATASELTGRTIQLNVQDPDEWVAAQTAAGQPKFLARFLLGMYQTTHDGFIAEVDALLGTLLDHDPQTARDALAQPATH